MRRSILKVNINPLPIIRPTPSYDAEIYDIPLRDSEEYEKRVHQLKNYRLELKNIIAKKNELGWRFMYGKDKNCYTPHNEMKLLIKKLKSFAISYEICEMTVQEFQEGSQKAIDEAIAGELGKHRGYKEILVNLLFALSTMLIGYVALAFFRGTPAPIKCNTESVNVLNAAKEKLLGIS